MDVVPTTNNPLEITVLIGVALYVVDKVLDWLPKLRTIIKERGGNGNGEPIQSKAGNLSPEFWQNEFRKAVGEVMGPILERFISAELDQTEAIRELTREIRDDRAEARGRRQRRG